MIHVLLLLSLSHFTEKETETQWGSSVSGKSRFVSDFRAQALPWDTNILTTPLPIIQKSLVLQEAFPKWNEKGSSFVTNL